MRWCDSQVLVSEEVLLGVSTIDSDGGERMAVKVDCHSRKIGHVDHVDQVSLAGFDTYGVILAVVDQT